MSRAGRGGGLLRGAEGQGSWVDMGAKPPYPLTEGENGWRAGAGGRRRDVAWGKRSRALDEHGCQAPIPPLQREKIGGTRGQAGGDGALHGAKGQELWVNMGPSPHTPFIGKRKPLRIKIKILFIYIWPAKTQDHASIYSLAKRFLVARAELTNSAFLSFAHFAACTNYASICPLTKRFSAARAGLKDSAALSFGCENRKSPQNRIKIPAMQILSARNGTGGFFT